MPAKQLIRARDQNQLLSLVGRNFAQDANRLRVKSIGEIHLDSSIERPMHHLPPGPITCRKSQAKHLAVQASKLGLGEVLDRRVEASHGR
jgi:hypothetical protein